MPGGCVYLDKIYCHTVVAVYTVGNSCQTAPNRNMYTSNIMSYTPNTPFFN